MIYGENMQVIFNAAAGDIEYGISIDKYMSIYYIFWAIRDHVVYTITAKNSAKFLRAHDFRYHTRTDSISFQCDGRIHFLYAKFHESSAAHLISERQK